MSTMLSGSSYASKVKKRKQKIFFASNVFGKIARLGNIWIIFVNITVS